MQVLQWGMAQNYNVNTQGTQTFNIVGVELNTICRPGLASNGVLPQLTPVLENGTPPYTYQWEALTGNTATLNANNIAKPTITASTGTHLLFLYLTVRDNSTVQKVASKRIKIQLQTNAVYDLSGRDSYVDMLNEPNTQATVDPREWNIWQSPDIWNRRFQDGGTTHDNPEFFSANPNFIYTRVRNVGCADSPPNMDLRLYWTKASTGEDWADDWTIADYTNPSGVAIPAGREITATPISIPTLAPGQSIIVSHPWYPIQPQQYDPTINSVDVCVLARIEESTTAPFGMAFPEVMLSKDNIRNNNNIITRNLVVSDVFPGNKPTPRHLVFVGNVENIAQTFDIVMQPIKNVHLHFAGNFAAVGKITLYLGSLFDVWQQSGGEGKYEYYL
jgi:hypothetical protein